MTVQPKPSPDRLPTYAGSPGATHPLQDLEVLQAVPAPPRLPGGPRAFVTWPVEFEVDPWRP